MLKSKLLKQTSKLIALTVTVSLSTGILSVPVSASAITANDLNYYSNTQRANNGLSALSFSQELSNAAYAKASYMLTHNYWAHNAPDGTTPWDFITAAGYDYINAGENLAKDFATSEGVVNGWMNSPTHRANLLSSSYAEVGYAVVDGNLLGSPTTLVVAMYGSRAQVVPAQSAAPYESTKETISQPVINNTPVEIPETAEPTENTLGVEATKTLETASPITSNVTKDTDTKNQGILFRLKSSLAGFLKFFGEKIKSTVLAIRKALFNA